MNIYPWDEIIAATEQLQYTEKDADIYQQWNCEHCGAKQTMETPNVFYKTGSCEECKQITNIYRNGMNYMLHIRNRKCT